MEEPMKILLLTMRHLSNGIIFKKIRDLRANSVAKIAHIQARIQLSNSFLNIRI